MKQKFLTSILMLTVCSSAFSQISFSTLEKAVTTQSSEIPKLLQGFQKEHTDNSGIVYYGNSQNTNTVAIEQQQGSNIVFYGFDSKQTFNQFYNEIDKISLQKGCNLNTKIDDNYSTPIEVSCDCEGYFYYMKTYSYKGISAAYELKIAKSENRQFIIKEEKTPVVMSAVGKDAEFIGGQSAMNKYISKNLEITDEWRGKLVVQFVVEKDGSVSNVEVKGTCPLSLKKSLITTFQNMPKWKPAETKDGTPVRISKKMPLSF